MDSGNLFSNKITVILGNQGSGKTKMLMEIVKLIKKDFDKIFFIAPSYNIEITDKYKKSKNDGIIYYESWNNANFINLIESQKKSKQKTMLIFDDATYNKELLQPTKSQSETIMFFTNLRHLNCSIILTVHDFVKVTPFIRRLSKIFILKDIGILNKNHELIFNEFFAVKSYFSNYEEFIKQYDKLMKEDPYASIVSVIDDRNIFIL